LISPDSIAFSPSASTHKLTRAGELAHTERGVTMTKARLCPPWSNTFLLLQHKTSYVRVGASGFARGKLRRALRESGVTVREETSWRAPRLPTGSRPTSTPAAGRH
jgi:hypothetical protein